MAFAYDTPIELILVDRTNIHTWDVFLMEQMSKQQNFCAYDIESSQRDAHDGIKTLMKIDDDGFSHGKKLIFDFKRTKITGASFYFGHTASDKAFYVNFGHADEHNTVSISYLWKWMDLAKANNVNLIIHNRQYEHSVHLGSYGYTLPNAFCSLQLCVSAYNPDEYKKSNLIQAVVNGIKPLIPEIERQFTNYEHGALTFQQEELLGKFCAKSGNATHAYEGIVKEISYGYGLKKAVKSWFGHQMLEFKDTLGKEADMSSLTGAQVLAYGADDAVWAYRLFFRIYQYLQSVNPKVLETYIAVENPITKVFSETTIGGMKVNKPEILRRQAVMREEVAVNLRAFKEALREVMPSELPPMHEKLLKFEKWYKPESHQKYFDYITQWLAQPDDVSAYKMCIQVKNSTGNAWYQESTGSTKQPPGALLSINHYMAMRYILFVLCDLPCKATGGKIQSDKDARAEMLAELGEDAKGKRILELYGKLGSAEQAFKLYITPYLFLVDPDTGLMHPIMTSMLATRRTSCSNPNGQQLAKRGDSVFVRGFFQADDPDSVIISADWSAIELVAIAANSQDPEFLEAYAQRPHADLHSKAAAGVMNLDIDEFMALPDKKTHRTVLGKGANFEYWYSGWLMNTGKRMGWNMEQTADAVRGYADTFKVAEQWRQGVIAEIQQRGVVQLPDGHTRVRFEATDEWSDMMWEAFTTFGSDAICNFGREAIRRIQRRSYNQAVNFSIQGLCAALAKQTILRTVEEAKKAEFKARFMLLVHDELLFSVPRVEAAKFCDFLYEQMIQDTDLLPGVKVDSSVAMGYTFQPYDPVLAPYGQIELMEIQKGVPVIPEECWGEKASPSQRDDIINYLTIGRMTAAA